jgi:transcriptional regulator with XRE-family HTH domain
MTNQDMTYPTVERLIDMFGDWLKHRRELGEMHQLEGVEFDRIAHDLRISPGELNELVHQGPHAADELPKLLKALGIDHDDLARIQPMAWRDMERVRALCQDKRRCDRDLAAGTAAQRYQDYCLNAPTIELITSSDQ